MKNVKLNVTSKEYVILKALILNCVSSGSDAWDDHTWYNGVANLFSEEIARQLMEHPIVNVVISNEIKSAVMHT